MQIDRNFGAVFIVWDKLFGTFRSEDDAGVIEYGVTTPPVKPLNPLYLQLHEFFLMLREAWQHKDLRILVMAPDWLQKQQLQQQKENQMSDVSSVDRVSN